MSGKYTAAACANTPTFSTRLDNIFVNYYDRKQTEIKTLSTITADSANTKVGDYKTAITDLGTSFGTIMDNLNSAVSSVVDPTYGLVAGFNCVLIG